MTQKIPHMKQQGVGVDYTVGDMNIYANMNFYYSFGWCFNYGDFWVTDSHGEAQAELSEDTLRILGTRNGEGVFVSVFDKILDKALEMI